MNAVTYTKQEWKEDQLESPLYGGKILIAGGYNSFFDENIYFEFDCPATYDKIKSIIERENQNMSLSIININDMPDEFEIMRTVTAADIPCDQGRYIAKATWLWGVESATTIIGKDMNEQDHYFEFENNITWDFFKSIAEKQYNTVIEKASYDSLPEIFILVDQWVEYDI